MIDSIQQWDKDIEEIKKECGDIENTEPEPEPEEDPVDDEVQLRMC